MQQEIRGMRHTLACFLTQGSRPPAGMQRAAPGRAGGW
ncbi:hypothetical protein ASZ90_015891 [hydrocarbon metagenome]|uniref:Uncharacterized protein n=1 Tax=hydrocarbon metagenome TaxID=938273 RepID=A0A0W8F0P1_9ZZZZ